MSFEFLKNDSQLLKTGIQTPHPVFRNQFLEAIDKNQFFIETR
jgi:hypothetical protein